ncbi:hypothetical protein BDW59DRAFT_167942 [Aspergillus cavernicola]|uniref:ABM domain-containing protein n=1 Tax=Aspergillus cavernicola TaxID=176166 RepID=A0ABR4H8N0_9EURO
MLVQLTRVPEYGYIFWIFLLCYCDRLWGSFSFRPTEGISGIDAKKHSGALVVPSSLKDAFIGITIHMDLSLAPNGEFAIYGTLTAAPGHNKTVADMIWQIMKLSEAHEGTLHYCVTQDPEDPSLFHLFERYVDRLPSWSTRRCLLYVD